MIKKIVRIFSILVILAIILVVITTVLLQILFPVGKIKEVISAQLQTYLNRKVEIGNIAIDVFQRNVTFEKVKIYEKIDFGVGTFFEVEKFFVSINLLPLLRGNIVLDKISLTEPKIDIVKSVKEYNFADLLKLFASVQDARVPVQVCINNLEIFTGKVSYADFTSPKLPKIIFNRVDLVAKNISINTPFKVMFNTEVYEKDFSGLMGCEAEIDFTKQEILITKLDYHALSEKTQGGILQVTGKIANVSSSDKLYLNLHIQGDKSVIKNLDKILSLPRGFALFLPDKVNISITGNTKKLTIQTMSPS